MIIEPEFPSSFLRLLALIVNRQVQVDQSKAKLSQSSAKQLFGTLDTSGTGTIFLEDLYIVLKKHGVNLTKKHLKFINKYFGFNKCEKLNFQEFQKYFIQTKDPKSLKVQKSSNQSQSLADLIQTVLEGYNLIEEERLRASKDLQELKKCLCKCYQNDVWITRQLLKQALFLCKAYSRLNYHLLCNYIIGEQGKQITLKQLFLFEGTTPIDYSSATNTPALKLQVSTESKENKKLSLSTIQQQPKTPGNFKFKTDSSDILLQIENIESSIKQKKEMYSQRKKTVQDESVKSKPVGTLLKKSSVTDLIRPPSSEKKQEKPQTFQSFQRRLPYQQKYEEEFIRPVVNTFKQTPKQKYSFVDTIEEEKYASYQPQDVDELLKTRISSKSREQSVSKASSCARLKIQEIERRVMGRVGQRAAASKVQDYMSKVPSRMSANQLRSRYSSLTRN